MAALDMGLTAILGAKERRLGLDQGVSRVPTHRARSRRPKIPPPNHILLIKFLGRVDAGGCSRPGFPHRWTKPVSTKNMRSCPEQAYSVGGLMGPISGFHSRGRKRGTCTRGAGIRSRAGGSGPLADGQAAVVVAPGRGPRAVTGGAMGCDWPPRFEGASGRRP